MIVNTKDLIEKLNLFKGFIDTRCITCAYINAKENDVYISAFGENVDTKARFRITADIFTPDEQIVLPYESFDFIKNISSNGVKLTYVNSNTPYVEIESDEYTDLSIKAKFPVSINLNDIWDKIDIPLKNESPIAICDGKELCNIIKPLSKLIDKKYTKEESLRKILSNIHIEKNNCCNTDVVTTNTCYVVKTELSEDLFKFTDNSKTNSIDIPYDVIKLLSKIKYSGKINILSDTQKGRIRLEFEDSYLQGNITFPVLKEKFFNYKKMHLFDDSSYANTIVVNRKKFIDIIKKIKSLNKNFKIWTGQAKAFCIKTEVSDMEIKIIVLTAGSEIAYSASLPLSYNDFPNKLFVMGFNVDYFNSILSYFTDDEVIIYLPSEATSGILITTESENSDAYLLPIRLKN